MDENFIHFENVRKDYKAGEVTVTALHDVSFSIGRAEICVIVGESGAGKTTLLNILGGMDSLSEGRVTVDGVDISAFDKKQLTAYRRTDVGFVFQFYNLIPNLTALENVEIAAQLSKDSLDPATVLEQVGIPGAVNGGMMDKAANLVPVVEKMLPKLDSILTSVNALLADPALAASLHNVETITSNLTVSTRELNTLMAGLNKQVPGMIGKANGVLDNTNRLTANLASLDVQGTLNKVNQTLESAHQFTEKLNSNQGSLGLLMNDTKLYDNLTSTMSHADSLVIDLKAHPKRYVHFSVFGRKDK